MFNILLDPLPRALAERAATYLNSKAHQPKMWKQIWLLALLGQVPFILVLLHSLWVFWTYDGSQLSIWYFLLNAADVGCWVLLLEVSCIAEGFRKGGRLVQRWDGSWRMAKSR